MNKRYFISALLMTFIIPFAGFLLEHLIEGSEVKFHLFSKWFIFSAVGLRLSVVGIQQSVKPAFTAKEIFTLTIQTVFLLLGN